jgi:alpha-ketoglutarate-dependent taurine dioxygenase
MTAATDLEVDVLRLAAASAPARDIEAAVAKLVAAGGGEAAPALAARIDGLRLDTIDDASIAVIRTALLDHSVLLIPGQVLTDPQLIAFGRRIGELDVSPLAYVEGQREREHPEVLIVSNVKRDGQPIGVLGDAEVVWHSDNSYRETPLSYSLLHAVELPPSGGETCFASMYLAWETLPAELKARVLPAILSGEKCASMLWTMSFAAPVDEAAR